MPDTKSSGGKDKVIAEAEFSCDSMESSLPSLSHILAHMEAGSHLVDSISWTIYLSIFNNLLGEVYQPRQRVMVISFKMAWKSAHLTALLVTERMRVRRPDRGVRNK